MYNLKDAMLKTPVTKLDITYKKTAVPLNFDAVMSLVLMHA
jgi:hypothetical protein